MMSLVGFPGLQNHCACTETKTKTCAHRPYLDKGTGLKGIAILLFFKKLLEEVTPHKTINYF